MPWFKLVSSWCVEQAQRRFRERQKTLIGDLREQVGGLQNDLARQANQLFVVQVRSPLPSPLSTGAAVQSGLASAPCRAYFQVSGLTNAGWTLCCRPTCHLAVMRATSVRLTP